jgi:hypothetical protein
MATQEVSYFSRWAQLLPRPYTPVLYPPEPVAEPPP